MEETKKMNESAENILVEKSQKKNFPQEEKKDKTPVKEEQGDWHTVDMEEDLPEKRQHKSCGNLFPIHTWLFFLYLALIFILALFGTLLIINGNWINTGYFSLFAIINRPWPNLQVEDPNYHAMALEMLQLTCWTCGFFFWLFALYLIYVVFVYHKLMWSTWPWDNSSWNGFRKAADKELILGKVRDGSLKEQFNRMNRDQQLEMNRYKRPVLQLDADSSYYDMSNKTSISKIGKAYGVEEETA